jgi:hypothetical protein
MTKMVKTLNQDLFNKTPIAMSTHLNLVQYPVNLYDQSVEKISSSNKNPNVFLTLANPDGSKPEKLNGKYVPVSDGNIHIETAYFMVANISNIAERPMLIRSLQFGASGGMIVNGNKQTVTEGTSERIDGEVGQIISQESISFLDTGHNTLEALIQDWLPRAIAGQNFSTPPGDSLPEDQDHQELKNLENSALYAQYSIELHKTTKKEK